MTARDNRQLEKSVKGENVIDKGLFKDYISLGATIEDLEITFDMTHQEVEDYCERMFGDDFQEVSRKLQASLRIEAQRLLLAGARRGNSVAMKTLSNTVGQLMDEHDKQALDLRRSELKQKHDVDEQTQNMLSMFLGGVQQENEHPTFIPFENDPRNRDSDNTDVDPRTTDSESLEQESLEQGNDNEKET